MLADLEELEAMVSATLAFGRDASTTEPVASLDLAELLRTVLDETGDARPELAEQLAYDGPAASDGARAAAGAEAGAGQSGVQRGELWRLRARLPRTRPRTARW